LNLHGSYPASTSSYGDCQNLTELLEEKLPLGAEPHELLAAETRALLDAARDRVPVDGKRLVAFARACVELTPAGRLALAVVDGGPFAPRRALELAALVSSISKEAADHGRTGRT
jgi:hypothetical protein